MTNSDHDRHLRLVPLIDVATDTSKRNQILALAASGKISLYVPIQPGLVAYASRPPRISTAPALGSLARRVPMTPRMQRLVDEARRRDVPMIFDPEPRPEIAFLALSSAHAQSLLASQTARVHWFPHGLRLAPSGAQGQEGWLEPVALPSQLCQRPANLPAASGPWLDQPDEHICRIELRDLLFDDSVLSVVTDPSYAVSSAPPISAESIPNTSGVAPHMHLPSPDPGTHGIFDIPIDDQFAPPGSDETEEDPYRLRERFLGVYPLCAASDHFYKRNPEGHGVDQKTVQRWLREGEWKKNFEKLFTEVNSRLAFKLINPKHNEEKGSGPNHTSQDLSSDVVEQAEKYKFASHISPRLTLVALAAERWMHLVDGEPVPVERIAAERMNKLAESLRQEIRGWGISSGDELNAIVDCAIWPKRRAEFREAMRQRGSR